MLHARNDFSFGYDGDVLATREETGDDDDREEIDRLLLRQGTSAWGSKTGRSKFPHFTERYVRRAPRSTTV